MGVFLHKVSLKFFSLPTITSLLVATCAMLLWFRNLLSVSPESYLWADNFDSHFLRWTAEWGYYALGERYSWSLFWNAPIFYPHQNTLAYSDSLITFQLIYTPLRWLGVPTLTALYVGLATFAVGCFTMTVFLLRKLKFFSLVECLIIAYAAHFSLMMANFLPHYQLFGFHFAPPFFIALYLFFVKKELKWLAAAELLYLLGSCFSVYLSLSLVVMGAVLALFCLPELFRNGGCSRMIRLSVPAALLSSVVAVVLYVGHMRHYSKMVGVTSEQSLEEIVAYSAVPSSILFGRSIQSYWWKPHGGGYSQSGDHERAYFPGFLILLGATIAVGLLVRRGEEVDANIRRLAFVSVGMTLWAIILSWGPLVQGHRTPFYFLIEYVPVFKNTRAMGRYGMFAGVWLGVLLVLGVRLCLAGRLNRLWYNAAAAVVLVCYAVESLPAGQIFRFEEPLKDRYTALSGLIEAGSPVVELPCQNGGHLETILRVLEQMNGGLHHHGHLVVGYSGRTSPEAGHLIHLDQQVVSGEISFENLGRNLREQGVETMLINLDRYPPGVVNQLTASALQRMGFEEILRSKNEYLILRRTKH